MLDATKTPTTKQYQPELDRVVFAIHKQNTHTHTHTKEHVKNYSFYERSIFWYVNLFLKRRVTSSTSTYADEYFMLICISKIVVCSSQVRMVVWWITRRSVNSFRQLSTELSNICNYDFPSILSSSLLCRCIYFRLITKFRYCCSSKLDVRKSHHCVNACRLQ